jgi:hypothetical protein
VTHEVNPDDKNPLCWSGRGGDPCMSACGATCGRDFTCCNKTNTCVNPVPDAGCFSDLTWPYCEPLYSNVTYIPPCSGVSDKDSGYFNPGASCCLSDPTTDKRTSNCPPGWASSPEQDEWCTDDWNFFEENEYRHKCHRVCNN